MKLITTVVVGNIVLKVLLRWILDASNHVVLCDIIACTPCQLSTTFHHWPTSPKLLQVRRKDKITREAFRETTEHGDRLRRTKRDSGTAVMAKACRKELVDVGVWRIRTSDGLKSLTFCWRASRSKAEDDDKQVEGLGCRKDVCLRKANVGRQCASWHLDCQIARQDTRNGQIPEERLVEV